MKLLKMKDLNAQGQIKTKVKGKSPRMMNEDNSQSDSESGSFYSRSNGDLKAKNENNGLTQLDQLIANT